MRKFCPTVIGTLHSETDSTLDLLNILDILILYNVYQHSALKFWNLWHKGLLRRSSTHLPSPTGTRFVLF